MSINRFIALALSTLLVWAGLSTAASAAITQSWETNIEPFDMTRAVEYAPEYLMGYAAENPTTTLEAALHAAKDEFHRMEHEACSALVPGDRYRDVQVVTRVSDVTHDLALLPLWIAAYRYKGEVYRFLVNGQTGKVQGKAPTSLGPKRTWGVPPMRAQEGSAVLPQG